MLIDFLTTKTNKKKLKIALDVLGEFKPCESSLECEKVNHAAWSRMDTFKAYLEFLIYIYKTPLPDSAIHKLIGSSIRKAEMERRTKIKD